MLLLPRQVQPLSEQVKLWFRERGRVVLHVSGWVARCRAAQRCCWLLAQPCCCRHVRDWFNLLYKGEMGTMQGCAKCARGNHAAAPKSGAVLVRAGEEVLM
jgi:hypothetical protein